MLDEDTLYTVTVGSGARDTEDNSLIEFYWDFTTETDASVIIPEVKGKEPYGETGTDVPVGTKITVDFNVAMDHAAMDYAFNLSCAKDPDVEGSWEWTYSTETGFYTGKWTPIENLKYNTQYTVTISTGAMSQDGEYLQDPEEWSFKTEGRPMDEGEALWNLLEPLITGIMILVSAIAFLVGFVKLRKKKNKLRVYLEKIDDVYEEYKEDPKVCGEELVALREVIKKEVKEGELEENHFLILDKKIDEYLGELDIPKDRKGPKVISKGGLSWKTSGRNPMLDALKRKEGMAKDREVEIEEEEED
jgi:hypothetical protein